MQPYVAQRIRHGLVRRHVGTASHSEQRSQRVIVVGREFQRVVAARLDHRLLDAEFALDVGACDQHGAQSGDQISKRLAQRQHGRRRIRRDVHPACRRPRETPRAARHRRQPLPVSRGGAALAVRRAAVRSVVLPRARRVAAALCAPRCADAVARRRLEQSPPADPCPSHPATHRRRGSRRPNAAASGRPGRPDGMHPASPANCPPGWDRGTASRAAPAPSDRNRAATAPTWVRCAGSDDPVRRTDCVPAGLVRTDPSRTDRRRGCCLNARPGAPPLRPAAPRFRRRQGAAGRRHADCARRRRRSGRLRG